MHSGPEALRNGFNVNLSKKLLYETYLPHFKQLVDAGVATVMSAYNAVNGIPCAGHRELLEETLRQKWGFEGFVVSDAGTVSCMHLKKNPQSGGARAEVADEAWAFLADTVKAGHEVTADSAESAAYAEVLLGNFYRGVSGKLTTFIEGLTEAAPEGTTVTYMPGCNLRLPNLFDSTWSFGLAEWSEVAIVALGETPLMEGENGECILTETGGDRDQLGIPEVQMEYVRKLRAKIGERPLVVLLTGGSPIMAPELHDLADAILFAWYPGQEGGHAAADLIYGKSTPTLCVAPCAQPERGRELGLSPALTQRLVIQ